MCYNEIWLVKKGKTRTGKCLGHKWFVWVSEEGPDVKLFVVWGGGEEGLGLT